MKEREREEMVRSFGSVHDERSRGVADGGVTRITHLKQHGLIFENISIDVLIYIELLTSLLVFPNTHARSLTWLDWAYLRNLRSIVWPLVRPGLISATILRNTPMGWRPQIVFPNCLR